MQNEDSLFSANDWLPAKRGSCYSIVPGSFACRCSEPRDRRASRRAAPNSNPRVLPPGSSPHGKTYEEWSALWSQWFLPLSRAEFDACSIGRFGSVAFLLTGPPTCAGTVATGTTLFFPIADIECSSLETPPFYGAMPSERRTCAEGFLSLLFGPGQTLAVAVDGAPIHNLTSYGATSA